MTKISEGLKQKYQGGAYHQTVFSSDSFVEQFLARRRAQKLQPFISDQDKVFEFGVGTGLNLRYLKCQKRTGYDLSDQAERYCSQYSIEHVADLNSIVGRKFNIILCHHVLEHVPDPIQTINLLNDYLDADGRILLYVPFEFTRDYRRYHPNDQNMHLYSWNALTIGNLVTTAGLTVEQVTILPYGYEQRLANLSKFGMPVFNAAIWVARLIRPSDEIQLIARKS
ncbi:MAG: class I SAM-dependent methyltransferase [Pseudomonadota bacterium]